MYLRPIPSRSSPHSEIIIIDGATVIFPACLPPITFHQSLTTREWPGADHSFRSAAFCSSRLRRSDFAFPCFALSRRHRSPARPSLGRHHECVGDQFLRRFLSLLHLPDLLLARADFAICLDWYGPWSRTRFIGFDIDPLGKPTGRILLHAQPLARPSHHAGNRSTSCLWLVARLAPRRARQSTLAFVGVRNPTFCRSRCRLDRLLFGLRNRSACSNRAPRERAP